MPVTTRRQSRGLPQPNARDEGEETSSASRVSINEGGDDDDPMDGPLAKLSSSEVDDDDDDNNGGDDSEDEHVSSLSEGEDSESSEFGEGTVFLHSRPSVRSVIKLCTQPQQCLRLLSQNAVSWRKLRLRKSRRAVLVVGSRAGCRTCCHSPWTFFSR